MNQLKLPEFKILKIEENSQGDLKFTVEAVEPQNICPECYSTDCYKHACIERFARDLNLFDQRVGVKVRGHRYKCKQCGNTFTQQFESIDKRDKITLRLREKIKELSLKEPFAKIADDFSLSPTTVKRIFNEFVEQNNKSMIFQTPTILGIDEVHLNKQMRAVFTDIENLKILDILADRNKKTVTNFLENVPKKQKIKVVVSDMWQPYKDAAKTALPAAKLVIDKFHVIRYGNKALDTIRKSFKDTLTKKQRIKLKNGRLILLKNKEELDAREVIKRDSWFAYFPILEKAYFLKEGLRDIYNCNTKDQAISCYNQWKLSIPKDMKEFQEVSDIIDNWHEEIFNHFDFFATNAYTESINNIIKHIERIGRGYSFDVLRAKVLFGSRATIKPKYKNYDEDYSRIGHVMSKTVEHVSLQIPSIN